MKANQPGSCPVCKNELTVTKLSCERCGTELTGKFSRCKYCGLNEKLSVFLETFLRCRGNIREIERELKISYPTVKNLTDELLNALGLNDNDNRKNPNSADATKILEKVERGEISASEAAKMLRKIKH